MPRAVGPRGPGRNSRKGPTEVRRPIQSTSLAIVIEAFKSQELITFDKHHEEYKKSTQSINLYNPQFQQARIVVRPRNAQEAQFIVQTGVSNNVPITVRNGGHSYTASSVAREGILMDLREMYQVSINPQTMIATVGAGALWGQVYKAIAKMKPISNGYLANGGRCASVGVSGFVLGGGLGPWTRSFGMGCDTVFSFTLIDAQGRLVVVSKKDKAHTPKGKLFRALCGAGHGNFGIVVELQLELCKVQNEEQKVTAGFFTWYPLRNCATKGKETTAITKQLLMNTMSGFYKHPWANDITIDSTWVVDQRVTPDLGIRFTSYYDGNRSAFSSVIDAGITHEPLADIFKADTKTVITSRYLQEVAKNQDIPETSDWAPDRHLYSMFESFVPIETPANMNKFREVVYERLMWFSATQKSEEAMASCSFIHTGGKSSETREEETAYRWRPTTFQAYIIVRWKGYFLQNRMENFFKSLREKLRPLSINKQSSFYNFPNNVQEDKLDGAFMPPPWDHEATYFGENKEGLQEVKQLWDPNDYFHWDQGVRLPGQKDEVFDAEKRDEDDYNAFEDDDDPQNYPGRLKYCPHLV